MTICADLGQAARRTELGGWLVLLVSALLGSGCSSSGDAAAKNRDPSTTASHAAIPAETSAAAPQKTDTASEKPVPDTASSDAVQKTAPDATADSAVEPNPPSAAASQSPAPVAPPAGAAKYEVLVKAKDFKKDAKTSALLVNYDDLDLLKVINMKQTTAEAPQLMPDWLKGLDGKRVRVRGFMHPQSVFQESGIARFVLCRDTGVCCFGPNPTIYYLIEVTMKNGATTHYIENRPFDVVGTFKIQLAEVKETGEIFQLYHINDADVIER